MIEYPASEAENLDTIQKKWIDLFVVLHQNDFFANSNLNLVKSFFSFMTQHQFPHVPESVVWFEESFSISRYSDDCVIYLEDDDGRLSIELVMSLTTNRPLTKQFESLTTLHQHLVDYSQIYFSSQK